MSKEIEQKLYDATLDELLRRVNSGEATAADMSNAIKFLKDNNITAAKDKNPKLNQLGDKVLPFPAKTA